MRAEILGSVVVLPDEVPRIENQGGDRPVVYRLIRRDPTEKGFLRLTDPQSSVPWLRASVRRLEELRPRGGGLPQGHPGDWLLEIAVEGEPPFGEQVANVSVSTGLPRQPVMSLPVTVLLRPPVNLSATKLVLGGSTARETLLLSVRDGLDPGALRARGEPAGLEVELEPAGGRMYRVHVGWPQGDAHDGSILFSVGAERLRLPVERE